VKGVIEVQQFRDTTEGVAVAILMAGHNAYAPESVEDDEEGGSEDVGPQIFPNQKEGVKNFLRKLDPAGDKAAVFIYDENGVRTIDTFSNMFPDAVAAVEKAKVEEGTSGQPGQRLAPRLFQFIRSVIDEKISVEEDLPRRKILLIMSDGLDVYSGKPDKIDEMIKAIVEAARDANLKIYALGATPGNPDNLRYLKEIAIKTEGAYREIGAQEWVNIPDIFGGVAEEIKKQYVVTLQSDELESGKPLKFRVVAKTGGRTLEAEYAKDIKLDDKPFNWMKIVWIAVGVIGGLLFIFVVIKLIVWLKNRQPAQQEEQVVEYTGPSKGRLTITTGPHAGEEYHLTKDLTTIGKMAGNDIVLNRDDSTSKRHAGIKIDDMRYELADFNSTNGTFVNGRKINKQFLRDGDRIKLGETEMAFHVK